MIKKLPLLFGLFISAASLAQDIDNNDLYFTYTQLPLTPIKNTKNYQSVVVQKFEDIIKTKTDLYNQELAKADDEYKKALDAQALLQKMEDDKYAAALAAWNKKPKAEQILYASQIPQRTIIPTPTKRVVTAPDLPKSYDTQLLAGKYLKMEGFNNANDNPVTITVLMYGFNSEPPVVQERVAQKAVPATSTAAAVPEKKKYYYSIKYKHMMSYKLEMAGQGVITEQFPSELDNFSEFKTTEYDSISILERNWPQNKANTMAQIQDKAVYDNLAYINGLVNNKYGYMRINYNTLLSVVDEKKDYQDYKEAYVAAQNGYKAITDNPTNKAAAFPELDKAIGLWENAMKQSQPNNKKARVDRDVTEITILNLIEAYIWKDDYVNAKAYIDKLKTMDPERKRRRRMEGYEALLAKNKARFEANQ